MFQTFALKFIFFAYLENQPKIEKNLKDEYLKPGFEGSILKEFRKHYDKKFIDTDLDGE